MTAYILDTNVFVEGKNRHYGFDFCPAFWDWLDKANGAGTVASITRVADELYAKEDELSEWARERGNGFFLSLDGAVESAYRDVVSWALNNEPKPQKVAKFMKGADGWLIAHAKAYDCIVVTHEVHAEGRGKIQIPIVCEGMGVRCKGPYDMLRQERARFVLGPDGGA